MVKLTGGQAGIRTLRGEGVDTVFGIISIHMMPFYDALFDHQDAIRFISARHEHAAAHMADGYARATGRPGVCFTSSGPGAANSLSAMGEAYVASSPVLNLTSTAEEALYGRGVGATHDTRDQLGMFAPVTQWNTHVGRAEEIPQRIAEAFKRFRDGRPQPIEIEVAADVQANVVDVDIPGPTQAASAQADPESIAKAIRTMLSSRRMAVMSGSGVNRSGATKELIQLAEALDVPVFTTAAGKGTMPDDHPLCLGAFGRGSPTQPNPLNGFLDSLDTVVVVGSSLAHPRTKAQGLRLPNLVQIDIDGESVGKLYKPTVAVIGDAREVLAQLIVALKGKTPAFQAGFGREVKELREAISRYKWDSMPNAMRTMAAIRSVLKRDAIVAGDVARMFRQTEPCLEIYEPRTYLTPAWGGLGFGFPAAIGAKAGLPTRQVICITGDGGFQFNMQELGTCVQYGLSPVVMIFNDNAWGVLRERQKSHHQGRLIGTELQNPDFVKLADAYGANGMRVQSVKELEPALESALHSGAVTLIDVQTPNGVAGFR